MTGTVKLIAISVLTMLIVGSAYAVPQVLADPGRLFAAISSSAGTRMQAGPNPALPVLLEVWPHFCMRGKSYTLLSLPQEASFDMSPGTVNASGSAALSGADACTELGTIEDRKLILCRGQGPSRFTITTHNHGASSKFAVDLAVCDIPLPAAPSSTRSASGRATLTPIPVSAGTPARLLPALRTTTPTPMPVVTSMP